MSKAPATDTERGPIAWLAGHSVFRHYGIWFRRELAGAVRDVLLDRATLARPYLNAEALRRTVEEHIRGRANHVGALGRIMSIELAHRSLIDSGGPAA